MLIITEFKDWNCLVVLCTEVNIPAVNVWQHTWWNHDDASRPFPRPKVAVDTDNFVGRSVAFERRLCWGDIQVTDAFVYNSRLLLALPCGHIFTGRLQWLSHCSFWEVWWDNVRLNEQGKLHVSDHEGTKWCN